MSRTRLVFTFYHNLRFDLFSVCVVRPVFYSSSLNYANKLNYYQENRFISTPSDLKQKNVGSRRSKNDPFMCFLGSEGSVSSIACNAEGGFYFAWPEVLASENLICIQRLPKDSARILQIRFNIYLHFRSRI